MGGPGRDAARLLVVERDLVRAAFQHLTVDAFLALPFEALGPTKALLKRFFSTGPWSPADEDALAGAVGPGEGRWRRKLDPELSLDYGWENGRFTLAVVSTAAAAPAEAAEQKQQQNQEEDPLGASFGGPVVPEATPNPRSIRFRLDRGPHAAHGGSGPTSWYESAASAARDPAVARLFGTFDEVANVLVGPDFVAVSLKRATDWERLLVPVLAAVTEGFAGDRPAAAAAGSSGQAEEPAGGTAGAAPTTDHERRAGRLERAWRELGALRPAEPDDLAALEAAAEGDDPFRRQVAANLLGEADPATAASRWAALVTDPSRSVRRATVDAMVDAGREELRPLLEKAVEDSDAWIRWKALRGLAQLGADPSADKVAGLADDPDFRVRLEVAAVLRSLRRESGPANR